MNKKIDVLIPAFNEEDCVEELARRLISVFQNESNYDFTVYVIENGSTDNTWQKLQRISDTDPRFVVIKLSRNFRMDGGLTAGLEFATGDACVLMCADLQDPPEVISDFLRKWEEGFENIYAVIRERQGTSLLRRFNSRLFYKLATFLTSGNLPENASDFRLIDRRVYVAVRGMTERNRFIRGLVSWSGFQSIGIEIVRPERFAGESNADTGKVLDLALKGLFANSYKPLKIFSLIGIALGTISFGALFPLIYYWLIAGVPFAGFGTLVSLFLLGFSTLLYFLSIMAQYIALIYEEVKMRPNFIVSQVYDQRRSEA